MIGTRLAIWQLRGYSFGRYIGRYVNSARDVFWCSCKMFVLSLTRLAPDSDDIQFSITNNKSKSRKHRHEKNIDEKKLWSGRALNLESPDLKSDVYLFSFRFDGSEGP